MKEVNHTSPLETIKASGAINPELYKLSSPKCCIVLDEQMLSYGLVYEGYLQICKDKVRSPAITLLDAKKIVMAINEVERDVKKKKFRAFSNKTVDISNNRKFVVGEYGYKLGEFNAPGTYSMIQLRDLLNAFIWDKHHDNMGPFAGDYGDLLTLGQIERFGNVDKFATWHISVRNDFIPEEKGRLDLSGPYDALRYRFGTKEVLNEIIEGVSKLISTDLMEYCFKDEKSSKVGLRLFKYNVDDADFGVGISTDILSPNQRTFVFLGKESGERFLTFLRKGKKLFK